MPVYVGTSTEVNPAQAAKEAVTQAKAQAQREKFNLAIVFSSIGLSCTTLLKTISSLLGETTVLGCTGQAIISNKAIFERGIAVALVSLPESIYCSTACVRDITTKTGLTAGEELTDKLLAIPQTHLRSLGIIFSDALMQDTPYFVAGMQKKLGNKFPLTGLCIKDNLTAAKNYIYFKQELLNDGCLGMLWGGNLKFGLGTKHGWKPLGKPRRITQSTGNIIYQIDNTPAAQIYAQYLDYELTGLRKNLKRISAFYPLGIQFNDGGEYLLRNILTIQEDGSLVLQGSIPEKCSLRLMIGTQESCFEATKEAAEQAKRNLSPTRRESVKTGMINFVLVFDSISRYILQGKKATREIDILKESFGKDTPILGIYAYGEQSIGGLFEYHEKTYFHNQAINVIALGV